MLEYLSNNLDLMFENWLSLIEIFSHIPELLIANTYDVDMSIESLRSQKFSVGIFYFLVVGILVFASVAVVFLFKSRTSKLKMGEKILFGWIFFGIFIALGFGATQLLHGTLF